MSRIATFACFLAFSITAPAWSAISLGSPQDCDEGHEVIFDQLGIVNPVYTVSGEPFYEQITVSLGSMFDGQTLGSIKNSLSNTVPNAPLALATNAPNVETLFDFANPGSIVVGGSNNGMYYTTPLAILFDHPVSHVCFDLGDLDPNSPTLIEAYTASGASLGTIGNLQAGTNRYAVHDSSGGNVISGISIYIPDEGMNMDWEGFAISNLAFNSGVIPEPGTIAIWSLLGLAAFGAAYSKTRQRTV